MSGPEQPEPSVSTAPAEGSGSSVVSPDTPLRRRRLPAHVGPARTSTVLLAAAFLLIGLLYLFVKPPEQADADPARDDTPATSRPNEPAQQAPATPAPSSTVPSTSEAPTTEPTEEASTSSPEEASDSPPDTATETTAPEDSPTATDEPVPTTDAPTS